MSTAAPVPNWELIQTAGIGLMFVVAAFVGKDFVSKRIWKASVAAYGTGAAVGVALTRFIAILDVNTPNRLSRERAVYYGLGVFTMTIALFMLTDVVHDLSQHDARPGVPAAAGGGFPIVAWAWILFVVLASALQITGFMSLLAGAQVAQ